MIKFYFIHQCKLFILTETCRIFFLIESKIKPKSIFFLFHGAQMIIN